MRRILFAYEWAADNITVQSGRPYSILSQMRARAEVVTLSPLDCRMLGLLRPIERFYRAMGQVYKADRHSLYLRSLARQIERVIRAHACDVVFSPGSQAVSLLNTDVPIVFCADAPFGAMVDFYDQFPKAPRYRRQGFRQEAEAHARCAAAIYPSRWAADTAIRLHGAAVERTHVIPFGANIDAPPASTIDRMLDARGSAPLRVLFVGQNWERKGGALAVEACRLARQMGREIILHVVGPSADVPPADPFVIRYGFLDKRQEAARKTLEHLFSTCHVLFTPSRAEAYGMAFCEAAAYAMPRLTTAVGGIPTIVEHDVSGRLLGREANAADYARELLDMTVDPERYRTMALSARREYDARLNWRVFTDRLWRILDEVGA